jgi:hypothetical protein
MAGEELYHSGPRAAEFAKEAETMDLRSMKEQIKSDLLSLNKKDELLNESDRDVKDRLESAKVLLDALKKRYPNDPDLLLLDKVYDDLKSDFDRGMETDIDSSFDTLISGMDQALKEAGVRKEAPDEKSTLSDTVAKLKNLGIEPEYVVTSGNPKAKTVVLFMQAHPNPGVTQASADADGITASQAQIGQAIESAVESGLTHDIFEEGLGRYAEVRTEEVKESFSERPDLQFSASWRAKEKYGDKINLKGYEPENMQPSYAQEVVELFYKIRNGDLREEDVTPEQKQLAIKFSAFGAYRMSSMNVFIASNIKAALDQSDQPTSFMILGGAHEKPSPQFIKAGLKENPLPISQALAYYGMNVVVVDAMSKNIHLPDMLASAK